MRLWSRDLDQLIDQNFEFLLIYNVWLPGPPERPHDASQSEICKQLARVVLDFAKPVFLTQPANRGIGIIVYKDPRNSPWTCPNTISW